MESHLGIMMMTFLANLGPLIACQLPSWLDKPLKFFTASFCFPESHGGKGKQPPFLWGFGVTFQGRAFFNFHGVTMANGCEMVAFGNLNQ